MPTDSNLFAARMASPPDSPAASFRCAQAGHLCAGQPPPSVPTAGLADCRSAEGAGSLIPVGEYARFFKSLKRIGERDVFVSVIAGPAAPYRVTTEADGQASLSPSCKSTQADTRPAVRLAELTAAFPRTGSFTSICSDSWADAVNMLAGEISYHGGPLCLEGPLVDRDPEREGLQVDCSVTDVRQIAADQTLSSPVPPCEESAPPCWRAREDPSACPFSGMEFRLDRGGCFAPRNNTVAVRCVICATPDDPRCVR